MRHPLRPGKPGPNLARWVVAGAMVLVSAVLASSTPAFAQDFSGENVEYEFGWKGIPAANATVKIDTTPCDDPSQCYRVAVQLTGKGYLDMFWKVRDRFRAICGKSDYLPRYFLFLQREGGFQLDTEIKLDRQDHLLRSTRFRVDKNKPYTGKKAPAEGTYGPLSSILYMRGRPLNVGDVETIHVFDGKREHDLRWTALAKERIKIGLGEFDAIKVEPRIIRSTGDKEDSNVEAVRTVYMWVSDDPSHLVLKIESEVFWGSVYAELIKK